MSQTLDHCIPQSPSHASSCFVPSSITGSASHEVVLGLALLGILLSTAAIRWQLLRPKRHEKEMEKPPVLDGERLHQEVPMHRWCVTKEDLRHFRSQVQLAVAQGKIKPTEDDPFDPVDLTVGPNMHTVTEQYIKPLTSEAGGSSWALMRNPNGIECDLYITHCWVEGRFHQVKMQRFAKVLSLLFWGFFGGIHKNKH